jgi:hypothetical protein
MPGGAKVPGHGTWTETSCACSITTSSKGPGKFEMAAWASYACHLLQTGLGFTV